jgi:hypothetical protein
MKTLTPTQPLHSPHYGAYREFLDEVTAVMAHVQSAMRCCSSSDGIPTTTPKWK